MILMGANKCDSSSEKGFEKKKKGKEKSSEKGPTYDDWMTNWNHTYKYIIIVSFLYCTREGFISFGKTCFALRK